MFCLSLILISLFWKAKLDWTHERDFFEEMRAVQVIAPEGRPGRDESSIELAMTMFGIEIPSHASIPSYDPFLKDRGLTTRAMWSSQANISIGPSAMGSWAMLGSTLAHEAEVHSKQSFLLIYLMDVLGLDGTGEAERQAYIYELKNSQRMGLRPLDSDLIADTMEYYYPMARADSPLVKISSGIRRWLAANLIAR